MAENTKTNTENTEQLSLNDDRRVKTLSPGALVAKRFFRNRLAMIGLSVLVLMFLFAFVGGIISPYTQDQLFYTTTYQNKDYAGVAENTENRFSAASDDFNSIIQAQMVLAMQKKNEDFSYRDVDYKCMQEGDGLYVCYLAADNSILGFACKDIISPSSESTKLSFDFKYNALKAYSNGTTNFEADGSQYTLDEAGGVSLADGTEYAYISRYVVNPVMPDVFLTRAFKEELVESIINNNEQFTFTDENGETADYTISYDAASKTWAVLQETETYVYDVYASPSKEHPFGTDKNGMDMITRLMYGGRVSLLIGFIVVIMETVLGVILGGISGYFGKWVDNLIMRIVDIFYCIPSTPILIILGAAMDNMRVDGTVRMIYLMLILGFLGWPGIARMVRGQILSLREQEFMTATEACGIRASRRIFKHLIPNVIPQLIVTCTMSLGSTIITEATLSFLGLGVKFPFASWGNIINEVNDTYVLTTFWFVWIPAGVCLLATVLAFNLVGDGLRDAFDPKMKR